MTTSCTARSRNHAAKFRSSEEATEGQRGQECGGATRGAEVSGLQHRRQGIQTAHFPLYGEATDLSPSGCYVRLLSSLGRGVNVDIVLWLDGVKLSFRGEVRTADKSVGNGIEFTGMNEKQRSQLLAYLDAISRPANS